MSGRLPHRTFCAILAACGASSGATEIAKPAGATSATSGGTGAATSATTGATAAMSAPTKTSGAPVTLKFRASVRGGTEFITASQNLGAPFTKQNPNITRTWEGIPSHGRYEKYTTAIASGTAADIGSGMASQAFQFYDTNNISPNALLFSALFPLRSVAGSYPVGLA